MTHRDTICMWLLILNPATAIFYYAIIASPARCDFWFVTVSRTSNSIIEIFFSRNLESIFTRLQRKFMFYVFYILLNKINGLPSLGFGCRHMLKQKIKHLRILSFKIEKNKRIFVAWHGPFLKNCRGLDSSFWMEDNVVRESESTRENNVTFQNVLQWYIVTDCL